MVGILISVGFGFVLGVIAGFGSGEAKGFARATDLLVKVGMAENENARAAAVAVRAQLPIRGGRQSN
ncbi:MAG TPA: hypothetical protein VGI16_11355 [Candidatus Acidoferrum sp.]|jgi:hypothetical protein